MQIGASVVVTLSRKGGRCVRNANAKDTSTLSPMSRRHSTSSPGADPHKAEDDSFKNVELQLCGSYDKENPRTEITVKEL